MAGEVSSFQPLVHSFVIHLMRCSQFVDRLLEGHQVGPHCPFVFETLKSECFLEMSRCHFIFESFA